MRHVVLLLLLVLTLTPAGSRGVSFIYTEEVFDIPALLAPPLNARILKTSESDGIVTEEVMFHSHVDATDPERIVDIFAILVYPKGGKKLPAFIWNQGGLAKADAHMITHYGAKRGYAAMCIDFPIPGYRSTGNYPINSGLSVGEDPRQAPIYHGAVALLRAVSYLQSRDEVDADRIGMAGSSWGGFYTTLMMGIDARLVVGSAMFGCGGMELGNNWWGMPGSSRFPSAEVIERWTTTLDPALRLQIRAMNIGWFTGTNDRFYLMPSVMRSYDAVMAYSTTHLTLIPNWDHGLPSAIDEQVFAFLDVHLKDEPDFVGVFRIKHSEPVDDKPQGTITWDYDDTRKVVSAHAIVSFGDDGNWVSRYWLTMPATMDELRCSVTLPASPLPFYISGCVVDEDGFVTSTPMVRVEATAPDAPLPDYDGCAEWGGFEPEHVDWLGRLGHMNIPADALSQDAKHGKRSLILKPGSNPLGPIRFTTGVAHRFTCWLKADAATEVTVRLSGSFDGKAEANETTVAIGPAWTEVTLEMTPPIAAAAQIGVEIVVAAEAQNARVDSVGFRPVR